MNRANIKPLSVNGAWKGKRFKTPEYKRYERDLMLILPPFKVPEGDLEIRLVFGFSNAASDWDNPVKPFQDVLQKKYGFDDKRIIRAVVEKVKVKTGQEFIEWGIYAIQNN